MLCFQCTVATHPPFPTPSLPPRQPLPRAVLSANETSEAQSLVQDILDAALNVSLWLGKGA